MTLIDTIRSAACERELLQVIHHGQKLAIVPLWESQDDAGPLVLAWSDLSDVQVFLFTELAGCEVQDLDRMTLPPILMGRRYIRPVQHVEALVLAARFELDVRFSYTTAKATGVRTVRGLSGQERLLYAAKTEALADVPRGSKVPKGALRSYRFDRVQWAEIPVDQDQQVRWEPGVGYTVDPT